ncbi:uncharacterized protein BXZ73DRAFT_45620 [Epithele typhae]|uniref:uncharacterized protein n=1 Tax=Epithele typhae TaxID=378194 RepID=UPI0020087DEC|nr:uncharacterized protein BXZ73DRAFT_45620 [Epithele typhae]KAH9935230.1 hypothetical protein BXZ73DRAFT_45620 [Epithele typhae]
MAANYTVSRVVDILSHLGGPECTHEDLQWSIDIPAGQQFLQWIATQVPEVDSPFNLGAGKTLHAALRPIALSQEELDLMSATRAKTKAADEDPVPDTTRVGGLLRTAGRYETPLQIRHRLETAEVQAEVTERQIARLKTRLKASKIAALDSKQAIHSLKKDIQSADRSIDKQQRQVAKLSDEVQNTISICTYMGDRITSLSEESQESGFLQKSKATIASLKSARSSAATSTRRLYENLDAAYSSLPHAGELQQDAARVQSILADVSNQPEALLQAAYINHLEVATKRLSSSASLQALLSECDAFEDAIDAKDGDVKADLVVDVKKELENAGRLDRLALLNFQERGLDEACITRSCSSRVQPALETVHTCLRSRSTLAMEAEAIVSALIEELEDINDAAESVRGIRETPTQGHSRDTDGILESEFILLLKRLIGSRPGVVERATVLLNREDVDREINTLTQEISHARSQEDKWVSDLRGRLHNLSSSTDPLVSTVYSNAPVNTSPPFAQPAPLEALCTQTRARAEELAAAAAKLQQVTELSSRDKRKLGVFVEKWTL